MDWQQRCIRFCGAMLVCAVCLRLADRCWLESFAQPLEQPAVASFLTYLQTGRVVRLPPETVPDSQPVTQPPTLPIPTGAEEIPAPVSFRAEDLSLIQVKYNTEYRPDLEKLLLEPLPFGLSGEEPTVLILHTHTTESYTAAPGQSYTQTSAFRTLDPQYNMLAIGDRIAALLTDAGIRVIHDRQFHDYPSYNGSYNHARESIQAILAENPSIRLILDLHRDAADTPTGQMTTQASVGSARSAQLMLVVGTGSGGLHHPDWERNCALALKLHAVLEKENPGICRDLVLSYSRYNQHLSPGALLVEVGAAGNTLDEALIAAGALAQGIITLFQGN